MSATGEHRDMPTARQPSASRGPTRRLWTRVEYERAAELGLFGPEERLELIEGEIVEKVTIEPPHAVSTDLAMACLRAAFPQAYVRCQQPLALGDLSEPEPDLAVVAGTPRDYVGSHPSTALLVVEIADTSLAFDRTTKAGIYARAGILEYWIVNLADRVLEVHRGPVPLSEQPLGFSYGSLICHGEADTIAPLGAPEHPVRVSDLLP